MLVWYLRRLHALSISNLTHLLTMPIDQSKNGMSLLSVLDGQKVLGMSGVVIFLTPLLLAFFQLPDWQGHGTG